MISDKCITRLLDDLAAASPDRAINGVIQFYRNEHHITSQKGRRYTEELNIKELAHHAAARIRELESVVKKTISDLEAGKANKKVDSAATLQLLYKATGNQLILENI